MQRAIALNAQKDTPIAKMLPYVSSEILKGTESNYMFCFKLIGMERINIRQGERLLCFLINNLY
ncbi:hypothetical protein [uncultured Helicobacter sp.]|uniref:hypothetical protein n=1 Tax=uncultured Helicobacter sp. TaxID=175537 RepID=UPI0026305173|nr:hypothetical protein [uncultured Helicobacter sp.]